MTPLRFVFGEDLFLSYSRSDSTAYAAALASELSSRAFSCFLDQWDTAPGQEIPPKVLRALDRSSMLVLVGSPGAARSAAVEREVRRFLATGRPIVPISVGGALEASDWFPAVAGASLSVETPEALADGEPSPGVLNRIESSFRFTRRNQRVRRTFLAAALGLLALIGIAGWAAHNARLATRAAEVSEARAEEQQVRADEATERAREEQRRAKAAEEIAAEQTAIAVERTEEARRQEEIARERLRRARSAELAASSRAQLAAEPDLASLLAVASLEAADTFEARRALLAAITERPALEAVLVGPERGRQVAAGRADAGRITELWMSRDGSRVAARDWDGQVTIWPLQEPPYEGSILASVAGLRKTSLDADLRWLAGIDRDGGRVLVRPVSGDGPEVVLETVDDPSDPGIAELALSPDGRWVALGTDDGLVTLWDARTGERVGEPLSRSNRTDGEPGTIALIYPVTALRFGTGGRTLHWVDSSGTRGDVEVPEGRAIEPLPEEVPLATGVSSLDGRTVAYDTPQGGLLQVRLYEGRVSGRVKTLIDRPPAESQAVKSLAMSDDGTVTAAGRRNGTISLFDALASRLPSAVLQAHSGVVTALVLSADGTRLVSGSDDGTVALWRTRDAPFGRVGRGLPPGPRGVQGREARFTPDGTRLLATAEDALLVVDPESGEPEGEPIACDGLSPMGLAVAPNGRVVAVGGYQATYRIDLATRRCLDPPLRPSRRTGTAFVDAVAFSPDGRLLAAGDRDGGLLVWDLVSDRPSADTLRDADRDQRSVFSLAWLPGSRGLVVGSRALERLWPTGVGVGPVALEEGEERSREVAGSRDGRRLAGSSRDGVVLWDAGTGRIVARFTLQKPVRDVGYDTVTALALGAGGEVLAAGQEQGLVSLFDTGRGQWLGDLPTPVGCTPCTIESLDLSPDGSRLAGVVDGELVVWPLAPEAWVRRACEIANRGLTEGERGLFLGPDHEGPGPCREARAGD